MYQHMANLSLDDYEQSVGHSVAHMLEMNRGWCATILTGPYDEAMARRIGARLNCLVHLTTQRMPGHPTGGEQTFALFERIQLSGVGTKPRYF